MTIRPALAAAVAAFAVVGSASAASLIIEVDPTLASITVDVPACGEVSETPHIPVTWIPERDCGQTGAAAPELDAPITTTPPLQPSAQEPEGTDGPDDAVADPPAPGAGPAEPSAPPVVPDAAPAEPGDGEPGADQPDVDPPTQDTPSEAPPATGGEEAPDA